MGDRGEHKGVQPPSHLLQVTDEVVALVRRVTRTGRKTIRHLIGRSPAHLGAGCVLNELPSRVCVCEMSSVVVTAKLYMQSGAWTQSGTGAISGQSTRSSAIAGG